MNYITISHINSQNARRRRENWKLNHATGVVEYRDVTTIQVRKAGLSDAEAGPLPRMISKAELRAARSIYAPHIGAKQKRKMALRA